MSNLKEIAQVNYDQIYPNATAQTSVKVEHFISEALTRYAWEMFRISKEVKRSEGEWEIPSALLRRANIDVVDNVADISSLNIFRSFEGDSWISNIGGLDGECSYIRQTVNIASMLLDDEFLGNSKPYTVIGNSIEFPKGSHKKTIPIIYASNGSDLDDEIEVDDAIGALVSEYIYKKFSGKFPEDRTQDSNSNRP